ncbi:unnamed protein product [Schistosoma spindalis]|nr:unnamed protein product [Schistosoma spindale]
MSVNLWDDSDSEDNLPAEWEQTSQDNFITYYNRLTGLSQRPHPISGHIKQLPHVLPKGWFSCSDKSGRTIYLNLETGCSTYSDPRLAAALLTHSTKSLRSTQFKFDKFSSVNDILLNKDLRGFHVVVTNSGCGLGLSIAVHLVQYGATVICACTKCPENAIPVFEKTKAYYEGSITVDLTLKSINKESGQLYWIPYNPLELHSIIQSVHILQSLNWPIHACIITDDLLPPFAGWNFFQSFTRIVSCLREMIPSKVSSWFKSIFKFVTNYEIQVFNWFGKKILPAWIPAYSCECSPKHFPYLTSDGFEVSMQCNYLAPALFLQRLLKTKFDYLPSLSTTSSDKTFDSSTLRVVIVSSEIHKDSATAVLNVIRYNSECEPMVAILLWIPFTFFIKVRENTSLNLILSTCFPYHTTTVHILLFVFDYTQPPLSSISLKFHFLICVAYTYYGVHLHQYLCVLNK